MIYGSLAENNLLAEVSDDDENSSLTGTSSSIYLPADFVPGAHDGKKTRASFPARSRSLSSVSCLLSLVFIVVCARGKSYWDHEGNRRYRALIGAATDKYSTSSNKHEKTLVVSHIVEAIHNQNGRFVKKEKKGGPWMVVDEVFAREKVGQSLRDGLHDRYKSSTTAKKQRRATVNEKFNGDIERVIHSNREVSRRIDELTKEVEKNGAMASDFSIITLFSRANSGILESIKKDTSMLEKFQYATFAANNESD